MAEKTIEVTIDKEGNFKLDLNGFKGKGCKDIAKQFEKMGKVNSEDIKSDYYEDGGRSNVSVGK